MLLRFNPCGPARVRTKADQHATGPDGLKSTWRDAMRCDLAKSDRSPDHRVIPTGAKRNGRINVSKLYAASLSLSRDRSELHANLRMREREGRVSGGIDQTKRAVVLLSAHGTQGASVKRRKTPQHCSHSPAGAKDSSGATAENTSIVPEPPSAPLQVRRGSCASCNDAFHSPCSKPAACSAYPTMRRATAHSESSRRS